MTIPFGVLFGVLIHYISKGGYNYGLVVLADTATFSLNTLPEASTALFAKGLDYGVYGSRGSYGVYGGSSGRGVYGSGGSFGVHALGVDYGVFGSSSNYAGYFIGDVYVAGTINKSAVGFKIDHPLDPANKYLYHTSIESPDMKNVYDGVVTLDNQGEATINMSDWFEVLNSNFRYQLTSIGVASPNLHIAQRLKDRKFKIAGGQPGQEISWQVTGIRQDAYAKAHRIPVEEDKNDNEKGKYLHPELFGQPKEMSVHPRPETPK